jgi:predicted dehydrogenase
MSSPARKKVRLAFIGAGNMGQAAHLRNYVSLTDECEVVALAELRPQAGERIAARYGIPKFYRDHKQLLAMEKIDGLVASQPFWRHGILLGELATYGLPLMSEKPISSTIQTGEKIVQALAKNKTWLMVGYHKRCDEATRYAKAEVDRLKQTGELGALRYIRITMPPGDWIAGGFKDNINSDEKVDGLEGDPIAPDMDQKTNDEYGSFVNFYIHQVNLMRHLLGESYRVTHADPAKVLLVTRSESGVTGVIEMAPYNSTVAWNETVLVAFERGYVKIELPAPLAYNRPGKVEVFRDPGQGVTPVTLVPDLPWEHAMRNQARAFISAVRGDAPAPCLADEALEDLRVAREYIRLLRGV